MSVFFHRLVFPGLFLVFSFFPLSFTPPLTPSPSLSGPYSISQAYAASVSQGENEQPASSDTENIEKISDSAPQYIANRKSEKSAKPPSSAGTSRPSVFLLHMKGPIAPALSDYLVKGIRKAEEEEAELVILELDTPGGLLTTTRVMVQNILSSPVPVAVYVSPAGAHAASAGTFITYAAHVAAMAPGTNIGAATPIQMQGNVSPDGSIQNRLKFSATLPRSPDKTQPEKKSDQNVQTEDVRKKAVADTSAFIRSLAGLRSRNAEWAVGAVTEAYSITAQEALQKNVIDIVAVDLNSLLEQTDGRKVNMAAGHSHQISSKDARVTAFPPDWKTRLLMLITHPNVALILMSIGVYGLILEFYNPGALIPGVIGAMSLILGLYAINILPVNTAGIILILLGSVFMCAELFIPSFGIMGFGGLAAFSAGLLVLFESQAMPGLHVSAGLIWGIIFLGALIVGLTAWLAMSAQKKQASTGIEGMLGSEALVKSWNGRNGHVQVQGEVWAAESFRPAEYQPGDTVVVDRVDKLTLIVKSR